MIVDLVQVQTADGLRLDGALQLPPDGATAMLGIDALVCLHGTGGNFYRSSLFAAMTPRLLRSGIAVLTVNTRGHDLINTAAGGNRRLQGAAYEAVDECPLDASAWINFLIGRGFQRIGLMGHSLGALKATYSLAHQERGSTLSVACLLAISPPRLAWSHFLAGPRAAEFQAELTAAEALVHDGRGEELMAVRFPLPYLVSAAGYVDKYGPAERYDLLKFAAAVPCPALYAFGSLEVRQNAAFQGLPESLEALAAGGADLKVTVITGADHFYASAYSELADRVEFWLRRTLAAKTAE